MPISGDIRTFSLAAIGRLIHSEKKTGILKVVGEGERFRFFFKKGRIFYLEGELDDAFSVETLLLAEHLITADALEEAKNIAGQMEQDITRILIDKKFVTEDDLKRLLHFRIKEAAAQVMSWKEGVFDYTDGLDDFQTVVPLKLDTVRFLAEAQKWREFRALIPNDSAVFRIKAAADSRLDSFSVQGVHRVMLMIDGERNVYEIMEETGMARILVYKALQVLIRQGAVELDTRSVEKHSGRQFSRKSILQYFAWVVGEVMADLALELGRRKSESILDKGAKETNHDAFFLQWLKIEEPTDTEAERMNTWMIEQQQDISAKDLFAGFQQILLFLLKEECRLLGFRSFSATIQRIINLSEKVNPKDRPIASTMISLLTKLLKEQNDFKGFSESFDGLTTEGEPKDGQHVIPFPRLGQVGGAAIIAFYSRVIQLVMQDLQAAIGFKATALIAKIITNSPYNERFLSQYQVNDDVKTNVERIRRHISGKGYRLSKISFIKGFQQALIELLLEEKHLLGSKPAIDSIRKIENQIPFLKQNEFKWLADHLLQTIKAAGNFETGA